MIQFPITHDIQIAAGYAALIRINRSRTAFYDDPMSQYAPVEDFMEDYDRKERAVLSAIAHRARKVNDKRAIEFTNSAFEKWMP